MAGVPSSADRGGVCALGRRAPVALCDSPGRTGNATYRCHRTETGANPRPRVREMSAVCAARLTGEWVYERRVHGVTFADIGSGASEC